MLNIKPEHYKNAVEKVLEAIDSFGDKPWTREDVVLRMEYINDPYADGEVYCSPKGGTLNNYPRRVKSKNKVPASVNRPLAWDEFSDAQRALLEAVHRSLEGYDKDDDMLEALKYVVKHHKLEDYIDMRGF